MRDLVFKNLTSKDKSRKIIAAKEIINEDGIVTRIQKHLIYSIHELNNDDSQNEKISNELFILKIKNTRLRTETFFIKMKSGMYANNDERAFIIHFLHSLRIDLSPLEV